MAESAQIDKLSIQIVASATSATNSIKKLAGALEQIGSANVGAATRHIGDDLQDLAGSLSAINTADLAPLTATLSSLDKMNSKSFDVTNISQSMQAISQALLGIKIPEGLTQITQFMTAINRMGKVDLTNVNIGLQGIQQTITSFGANITTVEQLTAFLDSLSTATTKLATVNVRLRQSTAQARKETEKANQSYKKQGGVLGNLGNTIKRVVTNMIIRGAIRTIMNSFTEGINAAYQWAQSLGNKFSETMDSFKTSLQYLQNSLAAMFAPLLNSIAPVFDKLVDGVVDAFNLINESMAKLFGQDHWIKAKKSAASYNSELAKTKSYLLGIDELNVLDSSSGSSDTDYSSMFESVAIGSSSKTSDTYGLAATWNKVKAYVVDIWDSVKPIFDKLMEWLKKDTFNIFSSIKSAVSNMSPWVQTIKTLTTTIKNWFNDATLQKIIDGLTDIVTAIGSLGLGALGTTLNLLLNPIVNVANAIMGLLKGLFSGLNGNINANGWSTNLGTALAKISSTITTITETTGKMMMLIGQGIGLIVQTIINALIGAMEYVIGGIAKLFGQNKVAQTYWDDASSVFADIGESWSSYMSSWNDFFTTGATSMAESVLKALNKNTTSSSSERQSMFTPITVNITDDAVGKAAMNYSSKTGTKYSIDYNWVNSY